MASSRRNKTKGPALDIIEGGQGLVETAVASVPTHPKIYSRDLPVSGAWFPGDPVGHRKFVAITDGRPVALEPGGTLPEVIQAYETWGKLNSDASNAILICHALSGNHHAAGYYQEKNELCQIHFMMITIAEMLFVGYRTSLIKRLFGFPNFLDKSHIIIRCVYHTL